MRNCCCSLVITDGSVATNARLIAPSRVYNTVLDKAKPDTEYIRDLKQQLSEENLKEKKKLVAGPKWVSNTKTLADRSSIVRVTLTLTYRM
jgi:hypothetical protein